MKLSTIVLTFLSLFTAAQICTGQDKPKAVLIDRLGREPCDAFMARLDNFFAQLQDGQNAAGYVVMFADENSLKHTKQYKKWIDGIVAMRNFAKDRLVVLRAKGEDGIVMEFWKVPDGAAKPVVTEEKWPDVWRTLAKAFVFGSDFPEDICPTFVPADYAELLLAHRELRGNIVIYQSSRKLAREEGKMWLDKFVIDHKVPRKQLKIFYRGACQNFYSGAEFWLVPVKKKR